MKAPDLARVAGQGDDRPGRVCLDIPHLDGLVVAAAHDPPTVKLDAGDTARVTLECPDVALTAHPGPPELVSLNKHLPSHEDHYHQC